jgi:Tol biopolymer transport system component
MKRMKKSLFLWFLIAVTPGLSFAQWGFPENPHDAWYSIETEHFHVHYHDGAERTGMLAAKIAEDVYRPITSLYRYEPSSKVHLIIRDHGDFANGAAFFYDNKIEIWASALDFDLRGTSNWLRNVIAHEFTHIVQIQVSMKYGMRIPSFYIQWMGYEDERRPDVLYGFPNILVSYPISGFVIPSWFAEGTAQFMHPGLEYDTWDSHRDMILRMYALDGNMLTWNEMSVFGKTSLGNESAYNAGYSLVRYIATEYGRDALRQISETLGSFTALNIDQAMRRSIGISGRELYADWQQAVVTDYRDRVALVASDLRAGEVIEGEGFGNFYPVYSPDGRYIAYVSNKGSDYFGLSSLYVRDRIDGKTRNLRRNIRSRIAWSPEGDKIYFSRITRNNPNWQGFSDLFVVDVESGKERRLTHGLRLHDPDISPDGSTLVAVIVSDGTQNIVLYDIETGALRYLTGHAHGEQVYRPRWSVAGDAVAFAQSEGFNRYIVEYSLPEERMSILIGGEFDARDAVYSPDGISIYYASDETGIFNIYRYNRINERTERITNVLGGAFMPDISEGILLYASYESTGYKIAQLNELTPVNESKKYVSGAPSWYDTALHAAYNPGVDEAGVDWKALRNYNDRNLPDYKSDPYSSVFTNTMLVPLIRFDNYIPERSFTDMIKPGIYMMTRDILEHHALFAGATINRRLERDLFAIFEWDNKLPPFSLFGWYPKASFEIYNITRKTDAVVELREDLQIDVDVTYNLTEFNLFLRDHIFHPMNEIEILYRHSRYGYDVSSFFIPETNALVQSFGELYLIGNTLQMQLTHRGIVPTIQTEINPVGRFIQLRYGYEFNRFNPELQYDESENTLYTEYDRPSFHRVEAEWREHYPIIRYHTVSSRLRGGAILGKPVDDFFNYYIGGLMGMQGYPFYSLGGNEYVAFNLTYRFPIWEGMDFRLLHMQFERLYGSVFTDVGDAWTGSFPGVNELKRNAGFELRLESFSFYSYPTRIFFSAAYGFDEFTRVFRDEPVTYGKQWHFYFGILFGFDLGTGSLWKR